MKSHQRLGLAMLIFWATMTIVSFPETWLGIACWLMVLLMGATLLVID